LKISKTSFRSVSISELTKTLKESERKFGRGVRIDDLTHKGVLRLGLESKCDHCQKINWHGLDEVSYTVACERCLKSYPYPQGSLQRQNGNFRYRLVGPFAVPDFAQGAYSSLLSLNALSEIGHSHRMTFSTGVKVTLDDKELELDFVAFWCADSFLNNANPTLVFGESKSMGAGTRLKSHDFDRLKAIGLRFPGAVLVVSVMTHSLSPVEVAGARRLAIWGRRRTRWGDISNPVVVLTGRELFADGPLSTAWKGAGTPFDKLHEIYDLNDLAEATQRAYLGLPSFYEFEAEQHAKRQRRSGADA
jgi:hypothetical protein